MHEHQDLAEAAAPQERERSGIHKQDELPDADAMTAIYGIGVQMVMRRGWKVHTGLGVRRSDKDDRLVAPLINERGMYNRTGIGWAPPQPPARLGSEASSSSHGPTFIASQAPSNNSNNSSNNNNSNNSNTNNSNKSNNKKQQQKATTSNKSSNSKNDNNDNNNDSNNNNNNHNNNSNNISFAGRHPCPCRRAACRHPCPCR